MNRQVTDRLPAPLLALLKQGTPALLLTVDEAQFPHSVFTWAVAPEASTVRFAVDRQTTTIANLERNGQATLQVIGENNLLFLIKGLTQQVKAQIEATPLKIALFALAVTTVKDQAWPQAAVRPLAYEWLAERREAMAAMEQAVYAEMLKG
jgi:hypothetical protein